MTSSISIESLHRGAAFHRADLHIHSFGASHDVHDSSATPENIVAEAGKLGLSVIALTDHNSIANVPRALSAASNSGVTVIPGVELSTPDGHLLAYFSSLRDLERFYHQLDIADPGSPDSRCGQGMFECLNRIAQYGGFGILAHVDGAKGYEVTTPAMTPHKLDVICHTGLAGIELTSAQSLVKYADGDSDVERARAATERVKRLQLGSKQWLARVLFSDSHSISALGRNALGNKRVTRVKMDVPSFRALKIALDDADARIRIEDEVPPSVGHVVGVQFHGGFLDGQAIHLSPNLNCIVGGRGTGKSMTFEAIRCLAGSNDSKVVDSEVWPASIAMHWKDAAGGTHRVQKLVGERLLNLDDPEFGPDAFRLESYGQGDTAKLSQRAQSDPLALLSYLDTFVDLADAVEEEDKLRADLNALQSKIDDYEAKVARIPDNERYLATTQQQLAVLDRAKASEIIQLQRNLAAERQIQLRLNEEWREISAALSDGTARDRLVEIQDLADADSLKVGGSEFSAIAKAANSLCGKINATSSALEFEIGAFQGVLAEQLRSWKAKETHALTQIDSKRKELEGHGVKLDMGFIQKLTNDEALYKKNITALKSWKPALQDALKTRKKALKERWAARERVASLRDAFARNASETLRDTLTDLDVSLKMVRNALSPDAEQYIQQVMGWRTNQVPRAALLTEVLTIPRLLDIIAKKEVSAITALAYEDGTQPFKLGEARELIDKLGDPKVRAFLEQCQVHDLPRIQVTKKIEIDGQKPRYITREFSRLSLGQQQSVLLSLLLSSGGTDPLIIDQPEDNLDGEFIYSTLVPVLRLAKERRQIIVVTHNANIAVLGDAELIVVLKSHNDKGVITTRGSIDDPATKNAACNILEGAEEAFLRRSRIYGIPRL